MWHSGWFLGDKSGPNRLVSRWPSPFPFLLFSIRTVLASVSTSVSAQCLYQRLFPHSVCINVCFRTVSLSMSVSAQCLHQCVSAQCLYQRLFSHSVFINVCFRTLSVSTSVSAQCLFHYLFLHSVCINVCRWKLLVCINVCHCVTNHVWHLFILLPSAWRSHIDTRSSVSVRQCLSFCLSVSQSLHLRLSL